MEIRPVVGMSVTAYGVTDVGRKRTSNEDAFLVLPLRAGTGATDASWPLDVSKCPALLAVADGVGGQNAGEVASRMALDALSSGLLVDSDRYCLRDALRISVERAHQEVKRAATEQRKGMGSTLVATLIAGDAAYVCGVGDSRLYIFRDGSLEQVTKDQTLYQHAIDNGVTLLDESSAQHVLLQVIGQPRELSVGVQRFSLHSGDVLLLCSDGLWGMVDDAELARTLAQSRPLEVAANELVARANANGGEDSITVILARVSDG